MKWQCEHYRKNALDFFTYPGSSLMWSLYLAVNSSLIFQWPDLHIWFCLAPVHRNLLVSGKLTRLKDLIKLRIGLNYNVRILGENFHLIKLSKIGVGPAPPPPLKFFWICACVLLAVTFLIMSKSIFIREFIWTFLKCYPRGFLVWNDYPSK